VILDVCDKFVENLALSVKKNISKNILAAFQEKGPHNIEEITARSWQKLRSISCLGFVNLAFGLFILARIRFVSSSCKAASLAFNICKKIEFLALHVLRDFFVDVSNPDEREKNVHEHRVVAHVSYNLKLRLFVTLVAEFFT